MGGSTPINLPLGFESWPVAFQALLIMVLTFVSEDGTAVSSAMLVQLGQIRYGVGFVSCFLGIWIGDAALYWLARGFGRPLLEKQWAQRFFNPDRISRSEEWFEKKGTLVLLASRLLPGTRLPTYLAAGFLKLPFGRFLFLTGIAVLVWTYAIFLLVERVGGRLLSALEKYQSTGGAVLVGIVGLYFLVRLGVAVCSPSGRRRISVKFRKIGQWEFWPAWLFYLPCVLYYLWLAIKHRSLLTPCAANPGIYSGGFVGESKIETLRDLTAGEPEFTARAILVLGANSEERLESLRTGMENLELKTPFVLKPDVGQRGVGVKIIRELSQAEDYVVKSKCDLILQEYVEGPYEAGVFYYRLPNESKGHIFSITDKQFPFLEGDGESTVEELIWNDPRACFMADRYLGRLKGNQTQVLERGERLKLVESGNHAQGCVFKEGQHLASERLLARIDEVSKTLPEFYFGRYDIRFQSVDQLKEGTGFKIIELNGAGSEATNIYDSENSLMSAYRTLFKQYRLVFRIGMMNRRLGAKVIGVREFLRVWWRGIQEQKSLPLSD